MTERSSNAHGPHQDQPVLTAGPVLSEARFAMIMLHGRGAGAADILTIQPELQRSDIACLAPNAAGFSWYPASFLAPLEQNEPGLSSGLSVIAEMFSRVEEAGIPSSRTTLLGFSQGTCLMLEFIARNPRRYGAVFGLSGGLIGPPGTPRDYQGSLEGTPIFLGCSDVDFHIPKERVQESTRVLSRMGAQVTERLYPGLGHMINTDEIETIRKMLEVL